MLNLGSYSQPMRLKSFIINGEEQKLDINYKLYFVNEDENIIYTSNIINDTFHYPEGIFKPKDTTNYHWLLCYKGKIYYFFSGWLFKFQEMEIIIETKAYEKYSEKEWIYKCSDDFRSSTHNTYGVVYIMWDSYSIACNPIVGGMRNYFRKGKELLKSSDIKKKKKGK